MEFHWVLDWNRIANLLAVLIPFFTMVGVAFKYLVDRSDKKASDLKKDADAKAVAQQQAADARRQADEDERDERRAAEMLEMRESRASFYADVLRESTRMRELYEGELARGISLRTALAEAAQREMTLQHTMLDLTRKVDRLQDEVANLRKELANAQPKAA